MSLSLQIENIDKEIKITKKNQLELKSTIHKMKNSLESLSNISELAEERISELEDRWLETMQSKEQKQERTRENEQSLREMWDTTKHPNTHMI